MSSNYPTSAPIPTWGRKRTSKPLPIGSPTNATLDRLISEFQRTEAMPRQPYQAAISPKTYSSTINGVESGSYPTATGQITNARVAAAPATGGTGVQNFTGGSTSNTAPPIGDAWDGFAGRYVPGQRDMLLGPNSPILHDWLAQDGRQNRSNLEGDMQRYADIAPRLYELLIGGSTNTTSQKDDTIINWIANMFGNQSKVGGRSPEVRTMLDQLFAGFNDKTSTLGSQMWDPSTGKPIGTDAQIANVMRYLPLVGEFSNSSYATSIYAQAQRLAQEYRGKVAKDQTGETFTEYLQRNLFKQ